MGTEANGHPSSAYSDQYDRAVLRVFELFPNPSEETQILQLSQVLLEQPLSSMHLFQPFADPAAPWVFFPDLEMGPVSAGEPLLGVLGGAFLSRCQH